MSGGWSAHRAFRGERLERCWEKSKKSHVRQEGDDFPACCRLVWAAALEAMGMEVCAATGKENRLGCDATEQPASMD